MKSTILLVGLLGVAGCSASGGDTGPDPSPGQGGAPPSGTAPPSPTSSPEPPVILDPVPVARCEPGVYRGDFSGQVSFIGIGLDASGTVELTLASKEETTTGEFAELSIENGFVTGTAGSGTYRADVIGKLNCSTLEIENGGLLNGSYNGFPPLTFEGPVTADYVLDTHTFVNGTWNIVDLASKGPLGGGTWGAVLAP